LAGLKATSWLDRKSKKPEELRGKQLAIQNIGGGGWANNMLALDYLGLDPDRDNIRFIVLGDQPSRIQALETGRAQASWMGSTFSAPLKKKGYTVLLDLARAPISYLGTSLVARKSAVRQEPKLYESMLKRHHRCHAVFYEAGKLTRGIANHGQGPASSQGRRR
jgi:ABC-type nitrate/sulfonate/bicarbonate transport system substrate-binding protein